MGKSLKTPESKLYLLAPPLFLAISTYGFSLFVNQGIILHGLALGVGASIVLYLSLVVQYLWRHGDYIPFSLESVSSCLHLFIIFFFSASVFAINIFLNFSLSALALIMGGVIFILQGHTIWINKFLLKETKWFAIINTLILVEIFLALSVLPYSFTSKGVFFAIAWYLLNECTRGYLLKMPLRTYLKPRIVFSIFLILMVIISSKWKM